MPRFPTLNEVSDSKYLEVTKMSVGAWLSAALFRTLASEKPMAELATFPRTPADTLRAGLPTAFMPVTVSNKVALVAVPAFAPVTVSTISPEIPADTFRAGSPSAFILVMVKK